ncbi:CsgE family curli-type amyloid fiber assembly protein [Rhodohalobacter sp. SW132]|nr:CsgE family curli-type amyloid fiber assembly protein [Rhodohalobacter sp. SW132]
MYRRIAVLLVMAALCLPGRAAFAQSGGEIDQLFALASDDGQIEQIISIPEEYSILADLSHFSDHAVSGLNSPGLLSTDFMRRSLFIPQVERQGLADSSRSFLDALRKRNEPEIDGEQEEEWLKALADFGEKSDEARVESFRKIFEAVLQEEENRTKAEGISKPVLELSGIVLDETRTKAGRDFYERFYSEFDLPKKDGQITLRIEERVFPGSGSLILIEVNQNDAFTVQLRPGAEQVEQAVQQAIEIASELVDRNNENYAIY